MSAGRKPTPVERRCQQGKSGSPGPDARRLALPAAAGATGGDAFALQQGHPLVRRHRQRPTSPQRRPQPSTSLLLPRPAPPSAALALVARGAADDVAAASAASPSGTTVPHGCGFATEAAGSAHGIRRNDSSIGWLFSRGPPSELASGLDSQKPRQPQLRTTLPTTGSCTCCSSSCRSRRSTAAA